MRHNFFVQRPILAATISLFICLCGIVALFRLPVSQFPEISPPSISVRASFPGANAETSAKVVAAQIEEQLNGLSNLLYMTTNTSSTGGINIQLTYEVGTNLDIAINEVLNRLYAAKRVLPAIVQKMGINARKSSSDSLMTIAFYSDPYINPTWVSNYLQRVVMNDLYLIPSVGNVSVRGAGKFSITAWLDPNKMARYKIGESEISNAINDQNEEYVVGRSNASPDSDKNSVSLNMIGRQMYSTAAEVANTVLRNQSNQTIRIKDVARVELSSNDTSTMASINFIDESRIFRRYPITTMDIQLSPGANQLEAKQQVLALLAKDAQHFPTGLKYRITQDNSRFVAASVHNVIETIIIAFILVAIVLFIFLHNWRASLVAISTIPVSILGTIACLAFLGYSLNTISLFALILAIGIVVDDAIVIVENVERLRKLHPEMSLDDVISLTMREVFGAIIAIVLVLSVVFLPVMGLGGLSGIMYRQFAVTIACAVIISGICSLSLTPAMCSLFMRHESRKVNLFVWFDLAFTKLNRCYIRAAERLIILRKTVVLLWLLIILVTLVLFKIISQGFVPNEDQGLVFASLELPSSYSLTQTESEVKKFIKNLNKNPNIDSIVSITGVNFRDSGTQSSSVASLIISLKNWSERSSKQSSADHIINGLDKIALQHPGMIINAYNQPPIRGLSTTGGVEFFIEDRSVGDASKLESVANNFIKQLTKHKEVKTATQSLNTHTLELSILPNVELATYYGVSLHDYYSALQTMYSNHNINFAYLMQGLIWVVLEADFPFRASIQNLNNVFVHSLKNDTMVPLATLSSVKYGLAASVVQHFNGYLASKVTIRVRYGYSMGDVMEIVRKDARTLPKGYNFEWSGTSYQAEQSQKTSLLAFGFSFIMIYLVLAALYEMWRLPLVVLIGVPAALFGAATILFLSGSQNDLYFQISLIALLGLSAKNIILLVEYGIELMRQGHSASYSAINALNVRFRPIVMISITFIAGTLPLVFAHGAGANAQHSVGLGIIGGVLGSVLIATLLTPAFFVMIMRNKKLVKV